MHFMKKSNSLKIHGNKNNKNRESMTAVYL